nr:putative transposase for insertion sequence [uncultured bacterium]
MQATTTRPRITATADGKGVVSHAGSRLLADVADRTTLTAELAEALAGLRKPRARHDPGRVPVDMAVAVADGATTISDVAVLADQAELFGSVASDSTCWRLLDGLDTAQLGGVARARAATREVVWAQRAELTGQPFPLARVAGRELLGLVIDLDASIVVCHSEKEHAAPTFKKTFGYHPMLAFCDNTGEFLAAQLRRGNAGSNTAADHITVLDAALAQLPDAHRHGTPILVRADTAGCTREFLAHVRSRRDQAVNCEFSVGWAITDKERAAIGAIPARVWADAIDADGGHRDGAGLAEITGVLPARSLSGYPSGTRVIVRRERPHPGAQLDAFAERDGWRYTAFATDTRVGQLARLERPPPRARPGRGPHSLREGHRPGPLPVPVVRDQPSVARRRHARGRPHLLDPAPAPARGAVQGRAEDAALPAAARRRPAHPRTTPNLAAHPAFLAVGAGAGGCVRPARHAAGPRWLTASASKGM